MLYGVARHEADLMGDTTHDRALIDAFLEEADESVQQLERNLLALEVDAADSEAVNAAFRAAHTLKGNSAMMGYEAIAAFTHAVESVLARLRDQRLPHARGAIDTLLASRDVLNGLLGVVRGNATVPAAHDAILAHLSALASPENSKPAAASADTTVEPTERPPVTASELEPGSIRVATDKVDQLVNLAGELAITQSMVAQLVGTFTPDKLSLLRDAVTAMEHNARDLQERVMGIRMLPLRSVLGRLPRVVRDLERQCGKPITLVVTGEETEIDKAVSEKIADPLIHLVRNAVDHGIESPEIRRLQHKPESGTVTLNAYQQGGRIYVEVTDDGRGLDRDQILTRARAAGLVAADVPLSDEDIDQLIFRPGLSTADAITGVSGRGVGMDVVKRNVVALGGHTTITTRPGHGTCFRISLPLTLAMLDGQLLQVGEHVYVLPLVNIVESLRPQRDDIRHFLGDGDVVCVRGQVLPILRLHELFGVVPATTDPAAGLLVIADAESTQVALFVDGLLEQQQVVIKSLDTNFQRVEGIAGATILGNGCVALILDVAGLITLNRRPRPFQPQAEAALVPTAMRGSSPHRGQEAPCVL